MKKTVLLFSISVLSIISCANESTLATTATPQLTKPEAVSKFNAAIKKVAMIKDPAPSMPKTSAELSDEKKDMLIPSAKELIASTGVSSAEIERQTNNDREKILKWAVQVYGEYNKKMNQNYQSAN
ncbi:MULTISPECIES: hypothetical protein [unclassified Chryseobacterium]|uniref:hypothetical protein n=1 Tax=unclassified Chryseobacterium TaxID=2593645 RepID=UPI00226AEC31|nr:MULTISPECIES: hypothetical protein [unclassified Chryseobacterium]